MNTIVRAVSCMLFGVVASTAVIQAKEYRWVEDSFEDFIDGSLDAAGQNIYVSRDGTVFGTYIHGIFDSDQFRRQILNNLRSKKGYEPLSPADSIPALEQRSKDLDKLAPLFAPPPGWPVRLGIDSRDTIPI